MAERPKLRNLAHWRDVARNVDHVADPVDEIMDAFCRDSDGCAEIELRRTFNEDADYIFMADVIWEGDPTSTEETDPGHGFDAATAVVLAIGRFLERWKPVNAQ